jgi:hypothetical protein
MTNAWQHFFPHPEQHWDGIKALFLITTEWTFLGAFALVFGGVFLSLWLEYTAFQKNDITRLRMARRWHDHLFMNKWVAYGLGLTSLLTIGLLRSSWVGEVQPITLAIYAVAAFFFSLGVSLHNSYGYHLMVRDLEAEGHVTEHLREGSVFNGYWALTCYSLAAFLYAGAVSWGSDAHQWTDGQFDGYFSYWGLGATWTLAMLLMLASIPFAALAAWFFSKPLEDEGDDEEFMAASADTARCFVRFYMPAVPVAFAIWFLSLPETTVNWTAGLSVLVAIAISYGLMHLARLKTESARLWSLPLATFLFIPLAVALIANSAAGLRELRAEQITKSLEHSSHASPAKHDAEQKEDKKDSHSNHGLQLRPYEME